MRRWLVWRPSERRLGVADHQPLESSLLCFKSVMPAYRRWSGSASDPVVGRLLAKARVALFNMPRLCVRVESDDDQGPPPSIQFAADRYEAVLTELAKRLPIDERRADAVIGRPRLDAHIRLFGHFTAATGLGGSARGTAQALAAADLSFALVDIPLDETHPETAPQATPKDQMAANTSTWPVNLVHTNPDGLGLALHQGRAPFAWRDLEAAFTIGYWAWEIESGLPDYWLAAYPWFDEIWAPSAHAAAAIAKSAPVPVVVTPHPIEPPPPSLSRAALGVADDVFLFLFTFDATSNIRRKNPAGLITAYRLAFPEPSDRVMLMLKTKKLSFDEVEGLRALAGGRDDIRIVNEPWDAERLFSLMAACDCYVSLHRAEGFGRGLAEAMYYGKPVIATGYSGNLDFMSADTAYLAPYAMTTLAAPDGPYLAGSVWAEPNLEAAAALMAQVEANRAEAAAVGARAAAWVKAHLSVEAVGRRMGERLAALRPARRRRAGPRPAATAQADPELLVLTPIKDARRHLPRYLELLGRLDYDPAKLSVGFLESDSRDGTYEALVEALPDLRRRFARVELHRFDYGLHLDGERWRPAFQRRRREVIARSRNRLLQAALCDEDWVLWLDADLVDYPPDLARRLIAAGKDVVVAHCTWPNGQTFDLNTFRFSPQSGGHDDPRYLLDGLYQPPRNLNRLYLSAFQSEAAVPVDAVGGTALLVRADLHREGLNFPPFSYRGYIETEGLAMMARDMGFHCWGLPGLRVVHADD